MESLSSYIQNYKYIPAIVGPTASGKSDIAFRLCQMIGGELVSCDSMQIYRGLDIGTAKPTPEERKLVRHHMIDIVDPDTSYSVSDYYNDSIEAIRDILSRGKLPVICGGTGQYISALVKGMKFESTDVDQSIIDELYQRYDDEGIEGIYSELQNVDPEASEKIHPNNTRRVIRAYAVYLQYGKTFSEKGREAIASGAEFPIKLFQPDWDRAILYDRINLRVDKMIEEGLVDEAKWLMDNYPNYSTAYQAIGYKELFPYIKGEISLDKAIYDLKLNTRHYAKRQLTWFRYMSNINKIKPNNNKLLCEIERSVN